VSLVVDAPTAALPRLIQGGMGIGVSSWRLAREVSLAGQLGVVSGTALDTVVARRLQDGDPGGHLRRALAAFPVPAMAERVLQRYFRDGGRRPGHPYRPSARLTLRPGHASLELAVVANFAEVWLAREGHDGLVGVNFLEKVQMATPAAWERGSPRRSRACSTHSRATTSRASTCTWTARRPATARRSTPRRSAPASCRR
jgi:NAD(P)H-dependent flavin oxidoreductase YrpB (nitropropane dioxygenase family)